LFQNVFVGWKNGFVETAASATSATDRGQRYHDDLNSFGLLKVRRRHQIACM
jgi:hypothetical protein